jgi:hypothetical protein
MDEPLNFVKISKKKWLDNGWARKHKKSPTRESRAILQTQGGSPFASVLR